MVTAPMSMWSHQLRATAVPRFVGSEVAWLEEQDNSKGDGFPPSVVLTHFQSFVYIQLAVKQDLGLDC